MGQVLLGQMLGGAGVAWTGLEGTGVTWTGVALTGLVWTWCQTYVSC